MSNFLTSLIAVAKRELQRMSIRPMYLLVTVVFPVLCILLFSSLFEKGVPTKLPIAIVDLDNTSTSRKLIRNIDVTPLSQVIMQLQSEQEAMSELRSGHVYGFVVFPKGLESDLLTSRRPQVSYYFQDGMLIAGSLVENDLITSLNTLSGGIKLQKLQAMGKADNNVMGLIQPVQTDVHMLFNPEVNYSVYISTIVLPILLQLFILLITVYCIGIEIKERTSREWLHTADKSLFTALAGKLLPYTVIFFIIMMFQNWILYRYLQVPMNTNLVWIMVISSLYVVVYQALGIFIIGLLPVVRHALYLTVFYGILAFTLCGFTFPTTSMHPVFQVWAGAFPVRHYMEIFQSQILAGFELKYSLVSYLVLMLFLLIPFTVYGRLKSALIYQNFVEKVHFTDALLKTPSSLPEETSIQ